jgi:hypothetical protein
MVLGLGSIDIAALKKPCEMESLPSGPQGIVWKKRE